MIKLNKKVAFTIFAILLFCIGFTINSIIDNNTDSDKIAQWLLLLSFAISAYLMSKIIFKSN